MGDPNCYTCSNCLENCSACPNGNITSTDGGDLYTTSQGCSVFTSRRKKIWKQSRMSSSQGLLKRKSMMVSKQVGQGACPRILGEAGGPGDLQSAIQKSNYPPAVGKAAGYNMGHLRNRVAYRNQSGVDRKHDSYQRYLARRVGGVLRKETMPSVINKTAYVGQPRNRTGTRCDCNKKLTTPQCGSGTALAKDIICCTNRIPNCDDTSKFTGRAILLGGNVKNRTCVAQRCRCPNCP